METLQNKKIVMLLFILAALVLVTPLLVRVSQGNPYVSGEETYYNLRIAQEIREKGILEKDALQDREYSFNLFHYFLAGLGFIDLAIVAKVLPFIFGMLFFWLSYSLMKRFKLSDQRIFLVLLFVILTPAFVLIFTTLTGLSLVLLLNLLGFYFFDSKKLSMQGLSIFIFALIPLIDFFAFILTFISLLTYVLVYKKMLRVAISSFTLSLVFIWLAHVFFNYNITFFSFITNSIALKNVLTDFGAQIGYSFFMLLLAVIGLVLSWRKKKSTAAGIIIFALFVFSFFNTASRVYMSFVFVIAATYAFEQMMGREWSMESIKRVTLLLIICTLIFSNVSFMNRQFQDEPRQELVNALEKLRSSPSIEKGTVLTHPSKGFYVEYFSGLPVVLDGLSHQYPVYEDELNLTNQVFATRDLVFAEEYLQDRNVKFILIDEEMREGLIWQKPHEGMLFLLENSEEFVNVSLGGGIDIYLYREDI